MASQLEKRHFPAKMLPDDLVLEILIMLPGKDTGRCKCVCKSWLSIIKSPLFRDIHRNRNGSQLLYFSKNAGWVPCGFGRVDLFRFYYSPFRRLKEPGEEPIRPMSELSIPAGIFSDQGIRIVNGLVCVATSEKGLGLDVQLTIYNVCTGERLRIPDPVPYVRTLSTFHLGYDPATRMYKILRLIFQTENDHVVYYGEGHVRANVMTLRPSGSSSISKWRKLNIAVVSTRSSYDLYNAARSENDNVGFMRRRFSGDDGVLCWFLYCSDSMILFDLNKEIFRRLKIPTGSGRGKQAVGSRVEFKESGSMALTLWVDLLIRPKVTGTVPRLECFVSEEEDDEGEFSWSWQYCREYPTEDEKPAASSNIVMASSGPDEILLMIPIFLQRAVYCYSFRVDKMEEFWAGNFRADPYFRIDGTPSYLGDSNHLYLTLNDVLRGVF